MTVVAKTGTRRGWWKSSDEEDKTLEEEQEPPVSKCQLLQEEQRYNLQLLEEHRLVEGQLLGEQASEQTVAAIVEVDLGIVGEQRAVLDSMYSGRTIRRKC